MPRVVKMMQKSKDSLKHNRGPMNPITREEIKTSVKGMSRKEIAEGGGSLRKTYLDRGLGEGTESRQAKVFGRLVEHPTPPVEKITHKKKPYLQEVGESLVSPETKKGLKLTTAR